MFLPLLSPLPCSDVADLPMRLVDKDDRVTCPDIPVQFRLFFDSLVFVLFDVLVLTSNCALGEGEGDVVVFSLDGLVGYVSLD